MFDLFSSVFKVDGDGAVATMPTDSVARDPDIVALRALFAGMSFNRGLYRVLENSVAGTIQRTVGHAFPALAARIECFGVDWLGRVFSADSGRRIDGKSAVVMLEPGSGQALEMPCHVTSFHDEEICECADAALADGFFRKWLASGGASPMVSQCVGYKRPLFLGGADELHNLELTDLDVYWTLSSQMIAQLSGVPTGTSVKISKSPDTLK